MDKDLFTQIAFEDLANTLWPRPRGNAAAPGRSASLVEFVRELRRTRRPVRVPCSVPVVTSYLRQDVLNVFKPTGGDDLWEIITTHAKLPFKITSGGSKPGRQVFAVRNEGICVAGAHP